MRETRLFFSLGWALAIAACHGGADVLWLRDGSSDGGASLPDGDASPPEDASEDASVCPREVPVSFEVIPIALVPGIAAAPNPLGINDDGVIVGVLVPETASGLGSRAFRALDPASPQDLHAAPGTPPEAVGSVAQAVNATGVAAGVAFGASSMGGEGTFYAMRFSASRNEELPFASMTGGQARVYDIHDDGTIVGSVRGGAAIWRGGSLQVFGGASAKLHAISRSGLVGGSTGVAPLMTRPVLFRGGVLDDLGDRVPDGGQGCVVVDLNDADTALISCTSDTLAMRGFLSDEGSPRVIVPLQAAGWRNISPTAMNNRGCVVGTALPPGEGTPSAFLSCGDGFVRLVDSNGTFSAVTSAADINNRGEIVGLAVEAGGSAASRGVLLRPTRFSCAP